MFEDKTPEAIHEALLSNIDDSIDKREGSIAYDLTFPTAIETGNVYLALNAVIELASPETTYAEYLDMWANAFGVYRKPATYATGTVTLTGPVGTVVPSGTQLQTSADIFAVTTEEVTLGATPSTVTARAETPGSAGNVAVNAMNALAPGELYGIVTVSNATQFDGGIDVETDEALRARFFEKARKPAASGNAQHYREWAMAVPGVGEAAVYPLHAGPGTVKVVILDADLRPPSSDIVNRTIAYVEENKPIGATVTIEGAVDLVIDVTATVTLKAGYEADDVATAFKTALAEYLRGLAFTGEAVRINRVGQLLIATDGVVDYTNLRLNGGTANITPTTSQVATAGTVTLNA